MTTSQYKIHPEAPLDADGYPVHPDPDKSHHICARYNSERSTPAKHGRSREDYPYCLLSAGHGTTDPKRTGEPGVGCKHHGGNTPKGKNNGSYITGAFSEYFEEDMTDSEVEAVNDHAETLAGDDNTAKKQEMARIAAKIFTRFQRSGDHRFLREYRQYCSEFNLVDATQRVAVDDAEAWRQYLDNTSGQGGSE